MSQIPLLDLKAQFETMREEIYEAIRQVVESQYFVLGPVVRKFEESLEQYVGASHAVGCASGTDALILALAALDIGPGDEVVTTPFSFFSTASCAYKVGARPRFVDIDPGSFNMDPEKLAEAIGPRTRAILPVHLFGQCAAMQPILQTAAAHDIPVVEDAAQALGSTYEAPDGGGSGHAGTLGRLGCYSFFPSKNLGGFGDGGAVVTDDEQLAERLRSLRVHGGVQMYHHEDVGWNSRLDALQAAVLAVKLPRLDLWGQGRAENAKRYDALFAESGLVEAGAVRLPRRTGTGRHIFNQYTLRAKDRDRLRAHLNEAGVGHSVYYPVALHQQECFQELGYGEGSFPEAERACAEVLSLPVYPELTPAMLEQVVETIGRFY
ncbi:MAG: DegT/DnrJ/EryC1/StrS family aminotransferase [Acidobacteria bacterium]|uniref:DegT/DnrJ/EryC1/StrS family aminotransferase n=1 Tax=Candidatus Polarisedimenticola svalbardensis TaxID=2886004 RepID=A0A8J7CDQ6_9BACT|nr:DegT/DnrJ/EryC1/StrS family aminotransferase [Candidatus Polarisedimenticola svalbardensis]